MPEPTARQLPLRRAETAAVFIACVHAVAGALALLLGRLSGSIAAQVEGWHLLAGVLVWLAALVHQRLRRLAAEEALAAEAPRPQAPEQEGGALFEPGAADLLTARNRLAQFEKYFLPAFSVVTMLALAAISYTALRHLASVEAPTTPTEPLRNFWAFAAIAFVSFLLAKYAAGLATQREWRPVRPGGNYTMSCAVGSLLVAIAFVFAFFELPVVERWVAWAIPSLLGLLAFETLLMLVMGIYRPRAPGQELRAAHDSRLLGMLTTSRGILRTTAETLDYQFGFRVSETWFYRFFERAIGPLIIFQAITLELLTCFAIVDTSEQAIIERFGVPRSAEKPLGPGLHLKWPWPIEIAYHYPTSRVEKLTIGEQLVEDAPGFLWTKTHAKQPFNLLAANRQQPGPAPTPAPPRKPGQPEQPGQPSRPQREVPGVSLITGTVAVLYYVDNLYDFLYRHAEPKRALEALCYRELSRYAAHSDFMEFLGAGRAKATAELKASIQAAADAQHIGVKIVHVSLQGIHPPVQVAAAFEEVVGALEERDAKVWAARGHENSVVPQARATAARTLADAKIYAADREHVAPATEKEFLMQLEASRAAPSVFRHRKLLSALRDTLRDARKIVKPAWVRVNEVLQIDLQEKSTPGMGLSIDTGATEGTTP